MNDTPITEQRDKVIASNAHRYRVNFADILSRSRNPQVCIARKQAMKELYQLGYTQAAVAVAFNRDSPSSVHFACRSIKRNRTATARNS